MNSHGERRPEPANTQTGSDGAGNGHRPDEPVKLAWCAYAATDDFENACRQASYPGHSRRALWAAFEAGFRASNAAGGADHLEGLTRAVTYLLNECDAPEGFRLDPFEKADIKARHEAAIDYLTDIGR